MSQRVQYPLTPKAKETARLLVEAWDQGHFEQTFSLTEVTAGNANKREFIFYFGRNDKNLPVPDFSIIREFEQYGLAFVDVSSRPTGPSGRSYTTTIEVTLLQELRNAVENNFEVSDYFLTLNAVGTIVHGDLVLGENALFQSSASISGNITQIQKIADDVENLVGPEIDQIPELKQALDELRTSDEPSRGKKLRLVMDELGRSLAHINNAGGAIKAIMMLGSTLQTMGLI